MNTGRTAIKLSLLASSLALALTATPAMAQDNTTGLLRGVVTSENGQQLENVSITLRHLGQGFTRNVQTNNKGEYVLRALPVGEYQVTVVQNGTTVIDDYKLTISLGQTAVFAPVLASDEKVERIAVVGSMLRRIDTSDSTAGLTFNSEKLELLPVSTGFENIALLTPGVTRGSAFGQSSSFGGGSAAENGYFLNGINITELRRGMGSIELPWEVVAQTQVKTGGISAEYDRFIGGVVNAVSKSGSNDFRAGAQLRYDPAALHSPHSTVYNPDGTVAINNEQYEKSYTDLNVWAAGALVQDKLFYYTLFNPTRYKSEYLNTVGTQFTEYRQEKDRWFVNLDWYITDSHILTATALDNSVDNTYENFQWDTATGQGNNIGRTVNETGGKMYSARYQGFITDELSLAATYGRVKDTRNPVPSNTLPGIWNSVLPATGQRLGQWTDHSITYEAYTRDQFRLDVTWLLDDHTIQFGMDSEKLKVNYNETQNGVDDARGWWYYESYNATNVYGVPAGNYLRKRVRESDGASEVNSLAFYIQDSWQITDNLVLNAGVRYGTFENTTTGGEAYLDLDDQIAPRLQLIWDPTGDGSSKIYGTFGRYYQPIPSNMNIRLASGQSDVSYIYQTAQLDNGIPVIEADGSPNRGQLIHTHVAQAGGGYADPATLASANLKPMYSDEFTLGYERQVGDRLKAGTRLIYRDLKTSIDDVDPVPIIDKWAEQTGTTVTNYPDAWILINPGRALALNYDATGDGITDSIYVSAADMELPAASRKYLAWEFTLEGRVFDNLELNASYVWSHSWGNTEGLVKSDNGQADPGWTAGYDYGDFMDHAYGNLPNDRRHAFKFSGIYDINDNWSVGLVARASSGQPKNRLSLHHPLGVDSCSAESIWRDCSGNYYQDDLYFYDWQGNPAPRGSAGTLDWFYELDASINYRAYIGSHLFNIKATVYNLFNFDTPIAVNEANQLSTPNGYVENPNWGVASTLQAERTVSFTVRYEF